MEFGVYNDFVPDYGILVNLHPFFLYDPCEENYKYCSITEIASFLTSFIFFIPYLYMNYGNPRGNYQKETLHIAKQFAFCGFTSLGYHGYLCFVTQFIDMLTIMCTLYAIIHDLKIPFTQKQEHFCMILFFLGLFHPLFEAFCMLYMIFKVAAFLLKYSLSKERYIALMPVIMMLLSFFLIFLDMILCPYQIFRYFHAMWHVTAFFAFSYLLIEIEFFMKNKTTQENIK